MSAHPEVLEVDSGSQATVGGSRAGGHSRTFRHASRVLPTLWLESMPSRRMQSKLSLKVFTCGCEMGLPGSGGVRVTGLCAVAAVFALAGLARCGWSTLYLRLPAPFKVQSRAAGQGQARVSSAHLAHIVGTQQQHTPSPWSEHGVPAVVENKNEETVPVQEAQGSRGNREKRSCDSPMPAAPSHVPAEIKKSLIVDSSTTHLLERATQEHKRTE